MVLGKKGNEKWAKTRQKMKQMGTKEGEFGMKINLELLIWAGISEPFEIQVQERIFLHFRNKGGKWKDIANGEGGIRPEGFLSVFD